MGRNILGNPILRYGSSEIIPSTVRLTQSPAANPYDPRATFQGDLQTELGVSPQAPTINTYLGRPSVARESAIARAGMTPAQKLALAQSAETAREGAIRQQAAAQQQAQQGGFFDRIPSLTSPAGQAMAQAATTGLQLSGYQDRPITIGQGLGAMAQAGMKAYTEAEEKRAKQEAAALQREQDLYIKMLELQSKQGKEQRDIDKQTFTQEKGLRDTLDKRSKEFDQSRMGFEKVQKAALAEPSGANDIALIFGFMKTIDPSSVVREGEFATAEQAGGVSSQVLNLYNRAVSGERLPPSVRKKFVEAARLQFLPALERQKSLEKDFIELSRAYELDPSKVVLSRLPELGSMANPFSVATEEEGLELPSGSYAYIAGKFARID